MTEYEWLSGTEYEGMLQFLEATNRAEDRKLRAFINACYHRQRGEMHSSEFIPTVALDSYLVGDISFAEMDQIYRNSGLFGDDGAPVHVDVNRVFGELGFADHFVDWADDDCAEEETAARKHLLLDIFGALLPQTRFDPAILSANNKRIPNLAQDVYRNREQPTGHLSLERLQILADALEEAGCNDDTMVSHLREPGPHVVGCWVVDLVWKSE